MRKLKLLFFRKIQVLSQSQNTVLKAIIILLGLALLYNIGSDFSFISTLVLGITLFICNYLLKITKVKL